MGQKPGDDRTEPSLELPSLKLPGLRRRRGGKRRGGSAESQQVEEARPPEAEPLDMPTAEPEATYLPPAEPEATHLLGAEPDAEPEPEPHLATRVLPEAEADAEVEPEAEAEPESGGRGFSLPALPGRVAAGLTGLVVGVAGAGATVGAMAGCEAVRGVSTCGGAPGFFILVAILTLMILLGAALLGGFAVGDAGSTSFLAVGIVAVVAMLTLLDVIFSAWMFAVIPVLSVLAYLLSHWVTTRFDESATGRRDWT